MRLVNSVETAAALPKVCIGLLASEGRVRRALRVLSTADASRLTIGVGPHPGALFLGKVARVLRTHPKLEFYIQSAIGRRVLDGSLALGLVNPSGWIGEPRPSIEPLAVLPLVTAARRGHPPAGIRSLRVEQVLPFPRSRRIRAFAYRRIVL